MSTIGEKITDAALEQLKKSPDGVRYADLVRLVQAANSSFQRNTIHGNVWDLPLVFPRRCTSHHAACFVLLNSATRILTSLRRNSFPNRPKKRRKRTFTFHLLTGL